MARVTRYASSLILASCLWTTIVALEVTPRSPCALKCIDEGQTDVTNSSSSMTFAKDLFCVNQNIIGSQSTPTALKFKDCNNCLKSSGYASDTDEESDRGWFLFNMRGIVNWCLFERFGEEESTNKAEDKPMKKCNSQCNLLYNAADYQIKRNSDSYNFCDSSGNFTADAEPCLKCIYDVPDLTILGNVLATVADMCSKKPGKVYDFPKDQEIFAATKIDLSRGSAASSSPTSSPTSSSISNTTPLPSSSSNKLSVGALAGIILGALIGVVLILCGILLLFRRRKNKSKAKTMAVEVDMHSTHSGIPPSYQYSAVGGETQQKNVYSYNSYNNELDAQHQTTEMSAHTAVVELPAANTNSPVR